MITKEVFDAVCNSAKLRLCDDDLQAVNAFMDEVISGIDKIELDPSIDLRDLELVNTFREDAPQQSLSRAEVISTAAHVQAGCVSIPINLRDEG
ncbi:MAG: hypothetical protein FWF80_00205 [Defluviitaleaceae bacterium]|nr:hypothetical protein [Defluviitaleaceae bacterium]